MKCSVCGLKIFYLYAECKICKKVMHDGCVMFHERHYESETYPEIILRRL